MKQIFITLVLSSGLLLMKPEGILAQNNETSSPLLKEFTFILTYEKEGLLTEGPSEEDMIIFQEHEHYLDSLFTNNIMLYSGRVTTNDPNGFGIMVVRASTFDEAEKIMLNEPIIREHLFNASLYPWQTINATNVAPFPIIRKEVYVESSLLETWKTWTTEEGLESFFAPEVIIDPRPRGELHIHFFPENEPGYKGAENNMILAMEDQTMLSFTWDAPSTYPDIRKQRTTVYLRFYKINDNLTKLEFVHSGFGLSDDWVKVRNYFEKAWDTVLNRLKDSAKNGPVDRNKLKFQTSDNN